MMVYRAEFSISRYVIWKNIANNKRTWAIETLLVNISFHKYEECCARSGYIKGRDK